MQLDLRHRVISVHLSQDDEFLRLALAAARGGAPAPNPHVGAIVVRSGEIVAVGHHERAGRAHAEVVALQRAGRLARGATLYVTLEPCNHTGRTPPCVDAIVAAGVGRVVIGTPDPNPHVPGRGAHALSKAGIEVHWSRLRDEADDLIAEWNRTLIREAVAR